MGIARYLSKLASVLNADGVVPAAKGGTGLASPGASGNLLVSDGTNWTSTAGLAGPTGPTGLGFTIAKTYSSVAQLTADTSPTGITAGQFALIDTGDINNAENSRLYVWNGTSYTYTSDLSGAQGIVGPTGPAGTNGIIGVDGAQGPTGPTGPAGEAASGGAAYDAGDVVVSAKASKYTAPTWLPCDGAMYTPGTYPQLDTIYQTAGDYTTTPGWFTEPRDTSGNSVNWYTNIAGIAGSILDPITGDLLVYNFNYPAGARVLYIQRASDGRFVYEPSNQLASDIQSDFGSASSVSPVFAISPNGQYLVGQKYHGGYLLVIYKRNTPAVESSTGVRWARRLTSTATTNTIQYWGLKISNDGVIIFPYASTSYYAYAKYGTAGNNLDVAYTIPANFQISATSIGYQGIDWHPTLTSNSICAVATATTSTYYSGMYYWNGGGLAALSYANTAQTYQTCAINKAGTAAYFGRSAAIDIYSVNTSTGALTFQSTLTTGAGTTQMISFSSGDNFMVVSGTAGVVMFKRTAPGAITYIATGYSPENYGNYGITNGQWKFVFDPIYDTLVGFGYNGSTLTSSVQNWKGTAKTIVPSTADPGKNLKYYIKTGS